MIWDKIHSPVAMGNWNKSSFVRKYLAFTTSVAFLLIIFKNINFILSFTAVVYRCALKCRLVWCENLCIISQNVCRCSFLFFLWNFKHIRVCTIVYLYFFILSYYYHQHPIKLSLKYMSHWLHSVHATWIMKDFFILKGIPFFFFFPTR